MHQPCVREQVRFEHTFPLKIFFERIIRNVNNPWEREFLTGSRLAFQLKRGKWN